MAKPLWQNFSDDELREIVATSISFREVQTRLGYSSKSGSIPERLKTVFDEKQIEQIVDVMANMSEILEDVTNENFDLSTYMKSENSNKFVDVLESLQNNATTENGVFKPAYDAMVNYVKNDAKIGAVITPIIDKNTKEGIIDWANVVAASKKMGE